VARAEHSVSVLALHCRCRCREPLGLASQLRPGIVCTMAEFLGDFPFSPQGATMITGKTDRWTRAGSPRTIESKDWAWMQTAKKATTSRVIRPLAMMTDEDAKALSQVSTDAN